MCGTFNYCLSYTAMITQTPKYPNNSYHRNQVVKKKHLLKNEIKNKVTNKLAVVPKISISLQ